MRPVVIILFIFLMTSCASVKSNKITMQAKQTDKDRVILNFKAGPRTVIYKTKENYSRLIPVTLSEDKSKIVSYPHPSDISVNGVFSYPTELANGFLLDNTGVTKNVAFLNMTYEEYSILETAPPLEALFLMIIDNDPLVEIYNCGNRHTFKNEISDLNKLINNSELSRCDCLKKE